MSLPLSLGAYRDCQQYFERATTDPKGIRLCGGDYDTCFALRQRMHYYRNLDNFIDQDVLYRGHFEIHPDQ